MASLWQAGFLHAAVETTQTIKKVTKKVEKPRTLTPRKAAAKKTTTHKVAAKKAVTTKPTTKKPTPRRAANTETIKKTTKVTKKPTRTIETHSKVAKHPEVKATEKRAVTTKPTTPDKKSWLSRWTGAGAATTAAAGTAAVATSNSLSRAINTTDRKKAELDKSWDQKNVHRFHESTYNELVKDENLKRARIDNGWHWLKLEEGKEGYSFYNPACGWMYFNNATQEWYQPCKKRYVKNLSFDLK